MRHDDTMTADEADALAGRAKTTSASVMFYMTLNHLLTSMLKHGLTLQ